MPNFRPFSGESFGAVRTHELATLVYHKVMVIYVIFSLFTVRAPWVGTLQKSLLTCGCTHNLIFLNPFFACNSSFVVTCRNCYYLTIWNRVTGWHRKIRSSRSTSTRCNLVALETGERSTTHQHRSRTSQFTVTAANGERTGKGSPRKTRKRRSLRDPNSFL